MTDLSSIGRFGEYEVWEGIYNGKPEWHITDGAGEFIYPGDDDLLKALMLISARSNAEQGAEVSGDTYVFTVQVKNDSPDARTAMVDAFRRIAPAFMFDGLVSLTLNGVAVND